MAQRISEYLEIEQVSGERLIQCIKCQHAFCPDTENYKDHALVFEGSPNRAGPRHSGVDPYILREFYCPGCATMLDVEMCTKGAPFVRDFGEPSLS